MSKEQKQEAEKPQENLVNLSEGTGKREHDQDEFDQLVRERGNS